MKSTPLMEQYNSFKNQYPDKIILYRMGDFFETFGDDAVISAKVLNITLTKRNKNEDTTALAGFPHHAIDQYLPKLVQAGHCVVVVDQLEDPKFAKGIVKRGVTRIVTPGTIDTNDEMQKNIYLVSIYQTKKNIGLTFCDIANGKLKTTIIPNNINSLNNLLNSFEPTEGLILQEQSGLNIKNIPIQLLRNELKEGSVYEEIIKNHFNIRNLQSIGLEASSEQAVSIAMILDYISETQKTSPSHLKKIESFKNDGRMVLDSSTISNLELTHSSAFNENNSLFDILNQTETSMGKRMLYSWILNPLTDVNKIKERINIVQDYYSNQEKLTKTKNSLKQITDIERIVGKIGLNRVNARELKALQYSLQKAEEIEDLKHQVTKLNTLVKKIDQTIIDNPPNSITEGYFIKEGVNTEIDRLKEIATNGKKFIENIIEEERNKTGISSMKSGYNSVFGYYIEVTKTHSEKVPEYFIRKQTLVNAERYITDELKQMEVTILSSNEKLSEMELSIFQKLREEIGEYSSALLKIADLIGKIDVLSNFAHIALQNSYCKPKLLNFFEKDGLINIVEGRHPVVEKINSSSFISNNTLLDNSAHRMAILTGPNMSGKSTYIRQVALIVLMAQIGSFVPAKEAEISITDRIFTRVGAHDDLSKGRSTFMVEMEEASNIVNSATEKSLIILDEIGRGTSTYDGVSIAWSLAEYLANDIKAKTLFATHYHELLKLEEKFPESIKNYNVKVIEDLEKDEVIFLRKIIEGGTDRSYGLYVAKMAGIPEKVLNRAKEILNSFEQEAMFTVRNNDIVENTNRKIEKSQKTKTNDENFSVHYTNNIFNTYDSGIIGELSKIDIDKLTPIDAINIISEWKRKIGV